MSEPTRLVVGPGEPDNIELGEVLERYRLAAGYSRGEAASQFEFTSEYLRLIEKGKRTPAFGTMPKILAVYNIDYQVDPGQVVFAHYVVKFNSRIREARYKGIENPSRDARLGQIVRLLTTADDNTLRDIYRRLTRG